MIYYGGDFNNSITEFGQGEVFAQEIQKNQQFQIR